MASATPAITGWLKEKAPARRRRQIASARISVRRLTATQRPLPDVLVIGAQRSGTSSLYKYLGAHPQAFPSLRKEVEYFSTRFTEGEPWYRAHFPLAARMAARSRRLGKSPISFEATPDYMLHPFAAARASELVPDARIIALLRNPIDRAISQYGHNRRLGQEPLTFEEALDQEDDRLAPEAEKIAADPAYQARPLRRYSYITRGRYAEQLERWQAWFPSSQMLIVRFEDLTAHPAQTLSSIESFLGIDDWHPAAFANHSYGRAGRAGDEQADPGLRARLAEIFRSENERLADLLGYDLEWSDGGGVST